MPHMFSLRKHLCRTTLSLGAFVALACSALAQVTAWGSNLAGQLNVSSVKLGGTVALSGGTQHALALHADGTVVAWGNDGNGECDVPPGLSGVKAIDAGSGFSLALKSDGTLVGWGANFVGQATPPTGSNFIAVSAGLFHGLALKSDGTVVAWGANNNGELTIPTGLSNVVKISAGGGHNLALKSDGTVIAWGRNDRGQSNVPSGLSNVVAIAAGLTYSVALKSDGTVVTWGAFGSYPAPDGLSNVVAIDAGAENAIALKSDGTVVTWGDSTNFETPMPTGLSGVVAIAAGRYFKLALKPSVGDDEYTTLAGRSVVADAAHGVLANDYGTSSNTVSLISQGTHGTVTLNSDGSFTYVPANATYAGDDTFTYQNNGSGFSPSIGTVTIHLSPVTLNLDSSSVVGGQYVRGTLSLGIVTAPTGGMTFNVDYGSGLTGPATVTVPAGQTSVRFRALSVTVDRNLASFIHAVNSPNDVNSPVTITPASLSSVVVTPGSVLGGGRANGTVRLNGQAGPSNVTVSLASADPAVVVPASVTIPAGSSSAPFVVTTKPVASTTDVTIAAGGTVSTSLKVVAASLRSLTLSRNTVPGGTKAVATVFLDSPAPVGGTTVTLASDNSAASLPTILTVPAGQTSRAVDVTTTPVASNVDATLSATLGGTTKSAVLTVTAAQLTSLSVTPNSTVGGPGHGLRATLTLSAPAPTGGVAVAMNSDNIAVQVPSSVIIPAGQRTVTFTAPTSGVDSIATCKLTATLGVTTLTSQVTVVPPMLLPLTATTDTVQGGRTVTITIELTGAAGPLGAEISLTSDDRYVVIPDTVVVPPGSTKKTFVVTTNRVSSPISVAITANFHGVTREFDLTINP